MSEEPKNWNKIINTAEVQAKILENSLVSSDPRFIVAKDLLCANFMTQAYLDANSEEALIEHCIKTAELFIEIFNEGAKDASEQQD